MPNLIAWQDLHDATLTKILVDWDRATCDFYLRLCSDPVTNAAIHVEGLRTLFVPREAPWGQSESINEALISGRQDAHGEALIIEMQSGDRISVAANSIKIVANGE